MPPSGITPMPPLSRSKPELFAWHPATRIRPPNSMPRLARLCDSQHPRNLLFRMTLLRHIPPSALWRSDPGLLSRSDSPDGRQLEVPLRRDYEAMAGMIFGPIPRVERFSPPFRNLNSGSTNLRKRYRAADDSLHNYL